MNIVAIGGGDLREGETLPIDEFIVELSSKESPKVLFVPTASGDAPEYCEAFSEIYGKTLGCRTEHLLLIDRHKNANQIQDMILGADIIYVGGGNTLRMMKRWRKMGVDRHMNQAGRQGTVLAGLSAGANCWHEWGYSDSRASSGASEWSYIRVKGLGLRPGMFCPHLDAEHRHEPLSELIRKQGTVGIGCDNNVAVWYTDDRKPVVKCAREDATVRLCRRKGGGVRVETFHCGEELEIAG